jgi:hypothetical protein
MNFLPNTPNFEETPTVAIEQGGTAEAAIDSVNETIDSVTDTGVFSLQTGFLEEKGVENSDTSNISS